MTGDVENSIASALPALEQAEVQHLYRGDALIAVAGFEERADSFKNFIVADKNAFAVVINYDAGDSGNRPDKVLNAIEYVGVRKKRISTIQYNRISPAGFADRLKNLLKENRVQRVTVDISAMSKFAILLCLDACRELNIDTSVFYSEARSYGPTEDEYKNARELGYIKKPTINIYTGFEELIRVKRFSSVAMQGSPTAIFSFMSFNENFIQTLLNNFNPGRVYLINGRPPEHSWREEATAWIHDRLSREWERFNEVNRDTGLPIRSVSTLKYSETFDVLNELYWEIADKYRIVLAPTGSKMQTVGCYFFRAVNSDVHIEYPTPNGYLRPYSEGIGKSWMIHFRAMNDVVNDIRFSEYAARLFV